MKGEGERAWVVAIDRAGIEENLKTATRIGEWRSREKKPRLARRCAGFSAGFGAARLASIRFISVSWLTGRCPACDAPFITECCNQRADLARPETQPALSPLSPNPVHHLVNPLLHDSASAATVACSRPPTTTTPTTTTRTTTIGATTARTRLLQLLLLLLLLLRTILLLSRGFCLRTPPRLSQYRGRA